VYAGMVEAMDLAVGKVLDQLDQLGLNENTLVVFTSDNGGLSTSEGWPTSNLPLRAGKGWMYEGGIRVPLLIRWPGRVEPRSELNTPVSSPDYFPTLIQAASIAERPLEHHTAPEEIDGQHEGDGKSLLPLFRGQDFPPDRALYWHYPHYGNQGGAPSSAIRRGRYKLIEWYEDGSLELFDLQEDVGEQNNLAESRPALRQELVAQLHSWLDEVGAQYPLPR
jgi:arylsulfatase A-like enzyme